MQLFVGFRDFSIRSFVDVRDELRMTLLNSLLSLAGQKIPSTHLFR